MKLPMMKVNYQIIGFLTDIKGRLGLDLWSQAIQMKPRLGMGLVNFN